MIVHREGLLEASHLHGEDVRLVDRRSQHQRSSERLPTRGERSSLVSRRRLHRPNDRRDFPHAWTANAARNIRHRRRHQNWRNHRIVLIKCAALSMLADDKKIKSFSMFQEVLILVYFVSKIYASSIGGKKLFFAARLMRSFS